MRQQFALSAAVSLFLLLQLTATCNGRAANTKDELASLVKYLESKIADKRHENYEKLDEEQEAEKEDAVEINRLIQSRGGQLTRDQKERVIRSHNKLRMAEGASNMQRLHYNNKLGALAQDWADRCIWGHRPQDSSFRPADYGDFSNIGENIWAWSDDSKKLPEAAIEEWYDEISNYNFDSATCLKQPCGHYTQVTRATTREVGCGLAKCTPLNGLDSPTAYYFVCNYGPGDNDDKKKPYAKGDACTECTTGKFYCTNGLCDDACTASGSGIQCRCRAKCGHGKQTSDCKCQCDTGYIGPACNDVCEDKNTDCGRNGGWPDVLCTQPLLGPNIMAMVNAQCPKMCGHCVSAKRNEEEHELLEEHDLLESLLQRMAEDTK